MTATPYPQGPVPTPPPPPSPIPNYLTPTLDARYAPIGGGGGALQYATVALVLANDWTGTGMVERYGNLAHVSLKGLEGADSTSNFILADGGIPAGYRPTSIAFADGPIMDSVANVNRHARVTDAGALNTIGNTSRTLIVAGNVDLWYYTDEAFPE